MNKSTEVSGQFAQISPGRRGGVLRPGEAAEVTDLLERAASLDRGLRLLDHLSAREMTDLAAALRHIGIARAEEDAAAQPRRRLCVVPDSAR